jgi:hypothetical protein
MQSNQEHNVRIDSHRQINSQLSEGGLVLTEEGVVGCPSRRSDRFSQLNPPPPSPRVSPSLPTSTISACNSGKLRSLVDGSS